MLRLSVKRFGQTSVSEVKMSTVEAETGQLLSFRSEARLGPEPNVVSGRTVNGRLEITSDSGGRTQRSTLAWPAEGGGFFAVEESLLRRPMAPGERRTLRALMPIFNQAAEIQLQAVKYEPTRLLDGAASCCASRPRPRCRAPRRSPVFCGLTPRAKR